MENFNGLLERGMMFVTELEGWLTVDTYLGFATIGLGWVRLQDTLYSLVELVDTILTGNQNNKITFGF